MQYFHVSQTLVHLLLQIPWRQESIISISTDVAKDHTVKAASDPGTEPKALSPSPMPSW